MNKVLSTGPIWGTWVDTKALLGGILAAAKTFPIGTAASPWSNANQTVLTFRSILFFPCSCAFHHAEAVIGEDRLQNSAGNAAAGSFTVFSSKFIYLLLV